jgi:virginiamycin B lyase
MSGQIVTGCPLNLSVETLSAWRDHALPPADLQRIREHLAECPSCEKRLADYDTVASALRRLRVPLPIGGYGRNPRLTGNVALQQPAARRSFRLPALLETLAAVLVIALLGGLLISLRSSGTGSLGAFATYHLPNTNSRPTSILAAPDGAIWFAEAGRGAIGRITPHGRLTEFPLAAPDEGPGNLIIGPDGNVWFTEEGGAKIGRVTPSGAVTEFPLPGNMHPTSVAAGPDGTLWLSTDPPQHVMRMSVTGQLLGEYPLPATGGALPGLARGPDGAVWFAVQGTHNIGRLRPDGTPVTFQSAVSVDGPLVAGPDGNVWFSGALGATLGRVSSDGHFAYFPAGGPLIAVKRLPGTLMSLTAGPDGNVWFTLNPPVGATEQPWVGRITRGGAMTLTRVPITGNLGGLTFGRDGTLWLTCYDLDLIEHFAMSG